MPNDLSVTGYRITAHARSEMLRRQISEEEIAVVLAAPGQVETARQGRSVYQSLFQSENSGKTYLVRVFVDIDRVPPEVVTVYRTSKITKYWRLEP